MAELCLTPLVCRERDLRAVASAHSMVGCQVVYGMVHIKDPLLLIEKSIPCSGGSRCPFLLNDLLLYVQRHITINKMLNVSLNKTFHSFLYPLPYV